MKKHRILLVEDTKEHAALITESLGDGYQITWCQSMKDALRSVSSEVYDLFLLDIMLPDGDGYQILAQLKNQAHSKDIPTIFMSSKKEVTDKVIGFSLGADDYIVKPCAALELKARVDSKLRGRKTEVLHFADLKINFLNQEVQVKMEDGSHQELDLTPREYKLLIFMARNSNVVLSREQILKSVWGETMHVSDRSIDTHVAALRKKMGPCAAYIKSVHGTGYRFITDKNNQKFSA
jgi:DNA-binding response OmpR family regulator